MKKKIISIFLSVVLIMFFANSSLVARKTITQDDSVTDVFIKTHFNHAEDFIVRNTIERGTLSDLILAYAKLILKQINDDEYTPLIAVTDGGVLTSLWEPESSTFFTNVAGVFQNGDKIFVYEISNKDDGSVLLTANSSRGDGILLHIKHTSLDPLIIRVIFDIVMPGKEITVKYEASVDDFGTSLVLSFKYDNILNFSYEAPNRQAIKFFDLARHMTSNSSGPTLTEIRSNVEEDPTPPQ